MIALLLGALGGAAPARLAALSSGRPVSPIADALARSLLVGITAVPVGRLCEQVAPPSARSFSLAMAAAMVACGAVHLVVGLRGGPKPRPGDDALRSAVRSPAIWAAILLVAFFARASLAILLGACFAAGNLLASAALAAPTVAARLRGPDAAKLTRATTLAAGAAIIIFGLGGVAATAESLAEDERVVHGHRGAAELLEVSMLDRALDAAAGRRACERTGRAGARDAA